MRKELQNCKPRMGTRLLLSLLLLLVTTMPALAFSIPGSLGLEVGMPYSFEPTLVGTDQGQKITVGVEPANVVDVKWTATSGKFTFTPLAAGKAVVTAMCGRTIATCEVTVTDNRPAPDFTLPTTQANVKVGETVTLTATNVPDIYDVVFRSENEEIAKVERNGYNQEEFYYYGTVKGLTVGETTIFADLVSGTEVLKTKPCKVTVTPVGSISWLISPEQYVGQDFGYHVTYTPADATIEFASSNPEVATVTAGTANDGKVDITVYALAYGATDITATLKDKEGNVLAEEKVTVTVPVPASINWLISPEQYVGQDYGYIVKYTPADATIEFASSNPEVATVTAGTANDGNVEIKVYALAYGQTDITATLKDKEGNVLTEEKVTVTVPVPASIETFISKEQPVGQDYTYDITYTPADAVVEVVSSDENLAKVTLKSQGEGKAQFLVEALAAGDVEFTVTLKDKEGNVLAEETSATTIIVPRPANTITMYLVEEQGAGSDYTYVVNYTPADAYIEFASSNPEVAKVTLKSKGDGKAEILVEALTPGKTTISAVLKEMGTSAEVLASEETTITVTPSRASYAITSMYLVPEQTAGTDYTYVVNYTPADAYIDITSSNEEVGKVTVKSQGEGKAEFVLEALAPGEVTVTAVLKESAASTDNIVEESETVTVIARRPAASISTYIVSEQPVGQDYGYIVNYTPADAVVEVVSSNDEVAKVTLKSQGEGKAEFLVEALAAGDVEITVTLKDQTTGEVLDEEVSAVKVVVPAPEYTLSVNAGMELYAGTSAIIHASNTEGTNVVFVSENEEIATVESKWNEEWGYYAVVTGVAEGNVNIVAQLYLGTTPEEKLPVTATCEVKVLAGIPTISVAPVEYVLDEGQQAALVAKIQYAPEGAYAMFESSNPEVATVNANGVITALAAGETTVTATIYKGTQSLGYSASCNVVVNAKAAEPTIAFSEESYKVFVEQTLNLKELVNVADAPEGAYIMWVSSDTEIATIAKGENDGVLTGVAKGEVTVTANLMKGTNVVATATCTVNVVAKPIPYSMVLSQDEANLEVGEQLLLTAILRGVTSTTGTELRWYSLNEEVVKAESLYDQERELYFGRFTALAEGSATVIANWVDKQGVVLATAECFITVGPKTQPEVPSITLAVSSAELFEGETVQINPTGVNVPEPIKFKSLNEAVATVDQSGVVTAVAAGETTILVYAGNGTAPVATAEFSVKVVAKPAPTVTLNYIEVTLTAGEKLGLEATVSENRPDGFSVVYTSSDEAVATVDATGVVEAVAEGNATITAQLLSAEGTVLAEATCAVTVVEPLKVRFDNDSYGVLVGHELALAGKVVLSKALPEGAVLVWSSDDANVATVDILGNVTGVAAGKTTVTVAVMKGEEELAAASCEVVVDEEVVLEPVLTLDVKEAIIKVGNQLALTYKVENAPEGASVVFTTSDANVADVTLNGGVVTGFGYGQATITATLVKGSATLATDECVITVYNVVTSVNVGPAVATIIVGDNCQLEAFFNKGVDPTESVVWNSANNATATVDENGLVTAVAPGYVNIYATSANGISSFCTVTVVKTSDMGGVESVEGDASMVTVEGNNIVAPEGATVYNLEGVAVNPVNLAAGVYIVRLADGQTVKVAL